jgi:prepilin-type N-terminal cleavage/methylation domain-containing protein/prepilin-type processing-associated H-X9-DG protein
MCSFAEGANMAIKRAFTLIELLVVIAIIALLLSILVPSLSLVKRKAASAVCLVNSKNLALGWFMYQQENDGRLMSATMESTEDNGTRVGWIGLPRGVDGVPLPASAMTRLTPPVTDEDEIRGIETGVLHAYIKSPNTYHCPADNLRKSVCDGTKLFASYQVPGCLYGYPRRGNSRYKFQLQKYSEITSPGRRYVFVESAEMRNWNSNGRFLMGAPEYGNPTWAWWVPLAVNHGDSSILGFCDGHAEVHKWRNQSTKDRINKLVEQGGTTYGTYIPQDGTQDIEYMAAGWAYRYKGP